MNTQFEQVMMELGQSLDLSITIPETGIYTLEFLNQVHVQFRTDPTGNFLLFMTKLATIPPGEWATRVFKEALIYNASTPFRFSTLSYSTKSKQLMMHYFMPLSHLKGENVATALHFFVQRAKEWQDALEGGQAGPPREQKSTPTGPTPFGLKL